MTGLKSRRRSQAPVRGFNPMINGLRQSVTEHPAVADTPWGRCCCCNRIENRYHGRPDNSGDRCSSGVGNHAFSGGTSYASNRVCVGCEPCFSSHACDPGGRGVHPHRGAGMTEASCGGVCPCRGPLSGGTLPCGSPACQSLPQPGWWPLSGQRNNCQSEMLSSLFSRSFQIPD